MYIHLESNVGRNLENLVDANGLSNVLEALSEICFAKASHLEEAWQDASTAKTWERDGHKIANLAARVVVR